MSKGPLTVCACHGSSSIKSLHDSLEVFADLKLDVAHFVIKLFNLAIQLV